MKSVAGHVNRYRGPYCGSQALCCTPLPYNNVLRSRHRVPRHFAPCRQWSKKSRCLACAKTVAVCALPVYCQFYNNVMFN